MVIDPWGTVLLEGGKSAEILSCEIDVSLVSKIREQGDKGKPIVIEDPKNKVSEEFMKIARNLTVTVAKHTREINEQRSKQVHIDLDMSTLT